MVDGFYWARHREDGELTVIQICDGGSWCQPIGNLSVLGLDEVREAFEILGRIPEPSNP